MTSDVNKGKTFCYLRRMKTIGFIGGLTWLSSMDYYRLLNQLTNEKLGGVSSCKILMYSVNFEEIKIMTAAGDWERPFVAVTDNW